MKIKLSMISLTAFFAAILAMPLPSFGAETHAPAPAADDITAQLHQLVAKVEAKIQAGSKTEADFSAELKEFDALLAAHKNEKTDAVANVLAMKGMLYAQVIQDMDKAEAAFKQVKADFPQTQVGRNVDRILAQIEQQKASAKVRAALKPGAGFPDFDEKDIAGAPLSVARFKGKIVLVDFWATWCGPCMREMPNVIAAYNKYHGKGFEIVGISLDQDVNALKKVIKEKNMPWPQYFDGKGWENKLSRKYGINSIPASFLIDGQGKIVAQDLRGAALDAQLGKLLGP